MKNFVKKILGLDKLEAEALEAKQAAEALLLKAQEAEKKLAEVTKTPKEIATEKKEPYFEVVGFHTTPENPRFGFWELDWNEYKVVELKALGYYGETDEEVIDQWFTEICRESGTAVGASMDRRSMGFIDVKQIGGGRSEIS